MLIYDLIDRNENADPLINSGLYVPHTCARGCRRTPHEPPA
jgi:hypothetical protein